MTLEFSDGHSITWDGNPDGLVVLQDLDLSTWSAQPKEHRRWLKVRVSTPWRLYRPGNESVLRSAFEDLAAELIQRARQGPWGPDRDREVSTTITAADGHGSTIEASFLESDTFFLLISDAKNLGRGIFYGGLRPGVVETIHRPPRKGGVQQRLLTRFISDSLFWAQRIARSDAKEGPWQAVRDAVASDEELERYVDYFEAEGEKKRRSALAVGLVDRGFRGAWERVGHPGLIYVGEPGREPEAAEWRRSLLAMSPAELVHALDAMPSFVRYRDPADVLREYLSRGRRRGQLEHLLTREPLVNRSALDPFWYHRFGLPLGAAPGAVARYFSLP